MRSKWGHQLFASAISVSEYLCAIACILIDDSIRAQLPYRRRKHGYRWSSHGHLLGQRCWMIDSSLPTHAAQRAHADKIPFCARLPCPYFIASDITAPVGDGSSKQVLTRDTFRSSVKSSVLYPGNSSFIYPAFPCKKTKANGQNSWPLLASLTRASMT